MSHDETLAGVVHQNTQLLEPREQAVAQTGFLAVFLVHHIGKDSEHHNVLVRQDLHQKVQMELLEDSSTRSARKEVETSLHHMDSPEMQGEVDHRPGTVPREDPRLMGVQVRVVDGRA